MEHKTIRFSTKLIGFFSIIYGAFLAYAGYIGVTSFSYFINSGDSDSLLKIAVVVYALLLISGIFEFILSFGILFLKKWGFICFYIFAAFVFLIGLIGIFTRITAVSKTLPTDIILAVLVAYFIYVQRKIF